MTVIDGARVCRNLGEAWATRDRAAGRFRLRLRYTAGARSGFWPGEEYETFSEAFDQLARFEARYPAAVFSIEEAGS